MRFEWYFEPETVAECIQLLEEYGPDAKVLAGGTDLVVRMRARMIKPKAIVSLNNIKELGRMQKTAEGVSIGGMCRLMDVSKSDMLQGPWKIIAQGAGHVSSLQVRNIATLGGNTCNASPSADTVPGLMILDAKAMIAGPKGERIVPLCEFFVGPGKTVLERGEMLTGFFVPNFGKGNGCAYKKYAIRGDTDIAIVNVGARIAVGQDGKISDARLVLGAVAPTPLRVPEVEKMLVGKMMTEELIDQIANAAASASNPITDARGTKEYRQEMIRVWTRHVLRDAHAQAAAA